MEKFTWFYGEINMVLRRNFENYSLIIPIMRTDSET